MHAPLSIPGRMRAVVLTAPGEFGLTDVPAPEPGRHEVLCRVRTVTICGTDLLPVRRIVLDELDLYGARASAGEMAQVIPLVAAQRIRLDALITHRFHLEEFDRAYRVFTQREGGALKVLLYPNP